MSKHLLIVESPAKAKTLHKYLGNDYEVLASYGHVRDLIPKNGAVDPEHDFAMHYEIIERNAKHVAEIVKALKKSDDLLLATDPDREGEAISWHLYELLNEKGILKDKPVSRVVFHEITKSAIQKAVTTPRAIAMDLVNAQQARRALDYLVGFNLSPLLWRKVQPGLSAGRVQSPALRMIVEREREIEAFKPQEYWKIFAKVTQKKQDFDANLFRYQGKKVRQFTFDNEKEAKGVIASLKGAAGSNLIVEKVETKDRKRNPSPPFTTSTMQQEASRKLNFSAQTTMRAAQKLYEGGYITYMRTDSVHLAEEAVAAIREMVAGQFGKEYLPKTAIHYATKSKNAQEAHEAIRPTNSIVESSQLPAGMGSFEHKLYDLIRKRAVACQMASAVLEQVSADLAVSGQDSFFRATGSTIKFPGFMKVYLEGEDDVAEEENGLLPKLIEGEKIQLNDIVGTQHFTAPPPRFSEASLIKTLEEYGIGRPSTYASIISTLVNREYVELDQRRFIPTTIGKVVNGFLTKHFQNYVDYDFTAKLEDDLDAVSRGEEQWKPLLGDFWDDFSKTIEAKKDIPREEVMGARELGIDPKTKKPVTIRFGRFGPFVQIGSKDDEERPKFASIPQGVNFEKITLEQSLELFKLPRVLGETEEGEQIVTNNGRFGPYVKFGTKFVSLPKDTDPLTVSLETALALIIAKKEEERQKYIKEIKNGDNTLEVLKGRFGPYVTNGSINASIPKSVEPGSLTLEAALELLEKAKERKAKRGVKVTTAKKPVKKATTKRKSSTKKKTTAKVAVKKKTKTEKTN